MSLILTNPLQSPLLLTSHCKMLSWPNPFLSEANHSGRWTPLKDKSHNPADWYSFESVTTSLKPVLTTGQKPCPITLVISLSHFLRYYPTSLLSNLQDNYPSSWADHIILYFFEKIGMIRWEWFPSLIIKSCQLPPDNHAQILCLLSSYRGWTVPEPVKGHLSSKVSPLSPTQGLYYYNDALYYYNFNGFLYPESKRCVQFPSTLKRPYPGTNWRLSLPSNSWRAHSQLPFMVKLIKNIF